MAEKLGISRNYVSMLEGGRDPSESLEKLLTMLEQSPLYARLSELKAERFEGSADQDSHVVREDLPARNPRAKIQRVLIDSNVTLAELEKKTKYPSGILDYIINGGGKMSESMAKKLAKVLPGISAEELMEGSEVPVVMDESGMTGTYGATPRIKLPGKGKTRFVPLLSWAAAGSLSAADALDESYIHEGIASSVPGRAFAVEIRGDSMHPEINPGDYAVVKYDGTARPGDVVLVRTIHGDVLCKRYFTRDGGKLVILNSVNTTYHPIELPAEEIAWIYPVKQVIRNY